MMRPTSNTWIYLNPSTFPQGPEGNKHQLINLGPSPPDLSGIERVGKNSTLYSVREW